MSKHGYVKVSGKERVKIDPVWDAHAFRWHLDEKTPCIMPNQKSCLWFAPIGGQIY